METPGTRPPAGTCPRPAPRTERSKPGKEPPPRSSPKLYGPATGAAIACRGQGDIESATSLGAETSRAAFLEARTVRTAPGLGVIARRNPAPPTPLLPRDRSLDGTTSGPIS